MGDRKKNFESWALLRSAIRESIDRPWMIYSLLHGANRSESTSLFRAVLAVAEESGRHVGSYSTYILNTVLRKVYSNLVREIVGRKQHRTNHIIRPPGQKLLRVSELLFSRKTVTLTFRPLIADWQFEFFEALKEKRGKWFLRIITLRYYSYYAKACGLSKVARLFKAVAKP